MSDIQIGPLSLQIDCVDTKAVENPLYIVYRPSRSLTPFSKTSKTLTTTSKPLNLTATNVDCRQNC